MGFGSSFGYYSTGGLIGGKKPPSAPNFGSTTPKFAIRTTQDFMKPQENIQIGGPNGLQELQNRYAGLKENAQQNVNQGLTNKADALKRRFAALGASGSGAQIKLQEQAQDEATKQSQQALNDIGFQEQNAIQNQNAQQADLDFKNRVFNFDSASKMHELDLAERSQQLEASAQEFNRRVAQEQLKPPAQGFLSSTLGRLV